jgi:hypothetical protein
MMDVPNEGDVGTRLIDGKVLGSGSLIIKERRMEAVE